jgi:hypothetical protein
MPLVQTRGAASAQGFGEFAQASAVPNYIEDVFSTWLYIGNGSTQTITNGIDLSTKGGLVWTKVRNGGFDHSLYDSARGFQNILISNSTAGSSNASPFGLTALTTGFTDAAGWSSAYNLATWTFRKQPKFFDVVTYTGTGSNTTIAHSLGSVPGSIIVKRTDTTADWAVYHRSLANTQYLVLNDTAAAATGATWWNSTTSTSSVFSVGTDASVNASGGTYVAYVFAHDAGGFGLLGTDNVISCGSYVGNGVTTGPTVTLGYEPQLLIVKKAGDTADWLIYDNMRNSGSWGTRLNPNLPNAENSNTNAQFDITATGFNSNSANNSANSSTNTSGITYIYIAIRRGPMKVPTVGTSVFGLSARTGTGANATVTGGQTDDAVLVKNRGSAVDSLFSSRLTGTGYLVTSSTAAEVAAGTTILQANPWDVMDGVKVGTTSTITNASANTYINYLFKRAPSVFDVVCYSGTGATLNVTHNLGAVPEMMIVKGRNSGFARNWAVYHSALGNTKYFYLNNTSAPVVSSTAWNNTTPTSSVFTVDTLAAVNYDATETYVAYLFATCAGVSKVGSYTGTGTTLQINCGFTAGSRFVMIKRTDSTGDWYVWDSARGIIAGNDPYLLLNSTAAEVTGTDYVDTYNAGFEISSTAPAAINSNGGSFIFFAVS